MKSLKWSSVSIALILMLAVGVNLPARDGQKTEKTYQLACNVEKNVKGKVMMTMNGRTSFSMLFVPETEMFLEMKVTGTQAFKPSDKKGLTKCEVNVATATIKYYTPGQPNQAIDEDFVDSLLWSSGIGARGANLKSLRDKFGQLSKLEGVPEEYTKYFKNDLAYLPNKQVKIGDKWANSFVLPIAIDLKSPPIYCPIKLDYCLTEIDEKNGVAKVDFKLNLASDEIKQSGKPFTGKFTLEKTGHINFRLIDGLSLGSKSTSKMKIEYSPKNFIESEEVFESHFVVD
jgi:hypothetical protein